MNQLSEKSTFDLPFIRRNIKENNTFIMHEYKYSSINFESFLISILSKTRLFRINHKMRNIYFRSNNKDI
jgi:hypothetical protein